MKRLLETKNMRYAILAILIAISAWEWASISEKMMYRRFMDSMAQTGTVMIEMDQRTGIITAASKGSVELFGREIVGANVNDLMPHEYRASHDAAIDRVNKSIQAGEFKPHVVSRQAHIKTTRGKKAVNLRVYATAESKCYAIVDPMETK